MHLYIKSARKLGYSDNDIHQQTEIVVVSQKISSTHSHLQFKISQNRDQHIICLQLPRKDKLPAFKRIRYGPSHTCSFSGQ